MCADWACKYQHLLLHYYFGTSLVVHDSVWKHVEWHAVWYRMQQGVEVCCMGVQRMGVKGVGPAGLHLSLSYVLECVLRVIGHSWPDAMLASSCICLCIIGYWSGMWLDSMFDAKTARARFKQLPKLKRPMMPAALWLLLRNCTSVKCLVHVDTLLLAASILSWVVHTCINACFSDSNMLWTVKSSSMLLQHTTFQMWCTPQYADWSCCLICNELLACMIDNTD